MKYFLIRLESGRPLEKLGRDPKMKRVAITDGSDIRVEGEAMLVFRTGTRVIDQRNIGEVSKISAAKLWYDKRVLFIIYIVINYNCAWF